MQQQNEMTIPLDITTDETLSPTLQPKSSITFENLVQKGTLSPQNQKAQHQQQSEQQQRKKLQQCKMMGGLQEEIQKEQQKYQELAALIAADQETAQQAVQTRAAQATRQANAAMALRAQLQSAVHITHKATVTEETPASQQALLRR